MASTTETHPAAPPAPTPTPLITLADLIGDTSHIQVKESKFELKGLTITTWCYSVPSKEQKTPLIAIHGGPSFSHGYLIPLKLLANDGHPVVFYDQAGCGKSTVINDPTKDAPWLLTIDYYLEELRALVDYYGFDSYYIYGSSWGTVVCQEYAVTQPAGLLGMMLDGAFADANIYIKTQWRDRISTLPSFTQTIMKKLIEQQDFTNPIYQEINTTLNKHFSCRLIPWPDFFLDCFKGMNTIIYEKMQGNCEFVVGGVLKEWTIVDRLHKVKIPTLVLAGEFDTMTIECSNQCVDNIATAWPLVVIPRAGHCKTVDEPQLVVQHVLKFMTTVDSIRSSAK